jgi:hypothetical protein
MKKILIALFAAALFITSCSKTGPTGPTGPAGANGNANVHGTYYSIDPANWDWDPVNNLNYVTITNNNISSNIIDSGGTVNVFITGDNITWYACPYTIEGNPSVNYSFAYSLNTIQINRSNSNQANIPPTITIYAKVVTITASQRKAFPATNWQDYNQVMAITRAGNVK